MTKQNDSAAYISNQDFNTENPSSEQSTEEIFKRAAVIQIMTMSTRGSVSVRLLDPDPTSFPPS